MTLFHGIVTFVVFVCVAMLALMNRQETTLSILGWQWSAPLVVHLLAAFLLGCLFTLLLMMGKIFGQHMTIRRLTKQQASKALPETETK